MKIDGFDWDDGNWPKCAKHGVTREQIEFVLSHTPMVRPDRSGLTAEIRYNALGRDERGRMLFVVFTFRTSQDQLLVRPISARFMHRKEIARYERR